MWHDLLGFEAPDHRAPKFVRTYAALERDATDAIEQFCADVRAGTFPSSAETYHMTDRMADALGLYGAARPSPSSPNSAPVSTRARARVVRGRGRVGLGGRYRRSSVDHWVARDAAACRLRSGFATTARGRAVRRLREVQRRGRRRGACACRGRRHCGPARAGPARACRRSGRTRDVVRAARATPTSRSRWRDVTSPLDITFFAADGSRSTRPG